MRFTATLSLLALTCLFAMQDASAQFFVKPHYISTTSSTENTVILSVLNPPVGVQYLRYRADDVDGQFPEEYLIGDTIEDYSWLDVIHCVRNADVLAYATMAPSRNFQVTAYQPPSSLVASDGSITIVFDNPTDILFMYNDIGSINLVPAFTDGSTYVFDNLRVGIVSISDNDPNSTLELACQITTPNYPAQANQFDLHVFVTDAGTNCNGSAHAWSTTAVGAVDYQWSPDPALSGPALLDLCPGVYAVQGVDANQQSGYKQFMVTYEDNNYYDPSTAMLVDDTLDFIYMNCEIDYSSPIDSIHFETTLVSQSGNLEIYAMNLYVYQGTDFVIVSDTIALPNNANVLLSVGLYCQIIKSPAFSGKKILIGNHGEFASVEENSLSKVNVFPNPSEDKITIEGMEAHGFIEDLKGRKVLEFHSSEIFIQQLESGMYLIHLAGNPDAIKFVRK